MSLKFTLFGVGLLIKDIKSSSRSFKSLLNCNCLPLCCSSIVLTFLSFKLLKLTDFLFVLNWSRFAFICVKKSLLYSTKVVFLFSFLTVIIMLSNTPFILLCCESGILLNHWFLVINSHKKCLFCNEENCALISIM